MAEPETGGTNKPAQPPKNEMSMEMRLLLAFLLMGAVMFVTPYFFKAVAPPPPPTKTAQNPTKEGTASQTTPPEKTVATPPAAEAPPVIAVASIAGATPQQPLPAFVIDTDLFRVTFSNQGATVRSWTLKDKKFIGNDGKPLNLVNTAAGLEFPFSLHFPNQKPAANVNWTYYKQTSDPDGLGVTYEYSDGHATVRKVFRFQKNSYLSMVSTEAAIDGQPVPHMIEWRGGFGDLTVPGASSSQRTLYFDVTANKLVEQNAKAAKNGPVTSGGNYSFAGLADTYFAAVFLNEGASGMQQTTFSDTLHTPYESQPQPFSGVAVSDGTANRFELFVGPKDVDLLRRINPKLEQVVDFGWMSILAKPLFLIVNTVNDHLVHNFGWAIVLVTIAINFVLLPLKLANMKSMRKMQALKPQVDIINEKYKNVGMRDPRASDKQQEIMDLYKKHGANPMGGCVPMLIQIPFFFAFYKVFTVSVEMRGASWLWVSDLSQPEHLAIRILPVIMTASSFFMQKMTPQAGGDPNQQKMMMFMPLIFGFMFYNFPSGLVLYYLTSNLVGMAQQWFFNHTQAAVEAAKSVAPPKPPKKNVRK
jgi:YidC/Oxa1 family membrane protein insertase